MHKLLFGRFGLHDPVPGSRMMSMRTNHGRRGIAEMADKT
jgi:hypothetical protein